MWHYYPSIGLSLRGGNFFHVPWSCFAGSWSAHQGFSAWMWLWESLFIFSPSCCFLKPAISESRAGNKGAERSAVPGECCRWALWKHRAVCRTRFWASLEGFLVGWEQNPSQKTRLAVLPKGFEFNCVLWVGAAFYLKLEHYRWCRKANALLVRSFVRLLCGCIGVAGLTCLPTSCDQKKTQEAVLSFKLEVSTSVVLQFAGDVLCVRCF